MGTTHDDLPHPVPPSAYLRYKENWLFIFLDITQRVFGIAHFNFEPGFDRARFSCNLMVKGQLFKYTNQTAFPADFAYSKEIGDGVLRMRFHESYTSMELSLDSEDVRLGLTFTKHAPAFDFETYEAANPHKPKAQEILNFSTNQEFHHQQQAMTVSGTLELKSSGGRVATISGLGYRDHSRGMRADSMLLHHIWAFFYFPTSVFAVMSVTGIYRPGTTSTSGYVYDSAGLRSLGEIEILTKGEDPGRAPDTVTYNIADVFGTPYKIVADIAGRLAYVPLVSEAAGVNTLGYTVIENFCPVSSPSTGEAGYALVEIGYSTGPARKAPAALKVL